ncbi:uncharacterized protein LOC9651763 isoform X3 [Selaginella moellendorffii]|uniref:uncharacterized protein LOC9651763 isoform X3 n=1 Tax=Selaginella moellendorffii TaxID=88036 RepID=UPI000D1C991D|nr:uncharacterized protein LOC9651763 isoform X3 [Selaginella moellendorffii]|eukprot:XP_024533511.1 uncharacterized protein LOC9651763 isoform X3 [Selaginella moellendorffii]
MASTPWVLIMVESRLLSVEHERADVESIHVICLLPVQLATSAKKSGSLSQQQDGNVPEVFLHVGHKLERWMISFESGKVRTLCLESFKTAWSGDHNFRKEIFYESSVSELQLRKRSCCEFGSPMKVYVSKLLKLNLYFILNSMTHSRFFFFGKGEATACVSSIGRS